MCSIIRVLGIQWPADQRRSGEQSGQQAVQNGPAPCAVQDGRHDAVFIARARVLHRAFRQQQQVVKAANRPLRVV